MVPENRAGAGGSIGSALVAKAAPDGYTLLINSNAHSVNPAIYAKLPYDTAKDFVDIVPLSMAPNVLVVNVASPYKSLMDLVSHGKAKPGAINFGHAGVGSGTHLNTEKLIAAADIKVTQVPFKGTPEVVQALFSNSVDCYWAPISAGMAHIKSGKLRALAVSSCEAQPGAARGADHRRGRRAEARMRRSGSASGGRPACRRTSSARSTPTCARR